MKISKALGTLHTGISPIIMDSTLKTNQKKKTHKLKPDESVSTPETQI